MKSKTVKKKEQKTAVLLVNLGTPDQPDKRHVRKYLTEFLNDPLVIDLPWLIRKLLVNLIIIPFRVSKSTALYKRLWTPEGSPLLIYLDKLQTKLQSLLGVDYQVFVAMRYGKPNIRKSMKQISASGFSKVVVVPLFPQYASSTTESVVRKVKEINQSLTQPLRLKIVTQFYQEDGFINAYVEQIRQQSPGDFDHIVMSYHSLPTRHIDQVHPSRPSNFCSCEQSMPQYGKLCYKAACYETSRLIAGKLGLSADKYTVSFQSRFAKNWIGPYTEDTIVDLARKENKKILVAAPSFVADCLETIVEIGMDYDILFQRFGGEKLVLVPSLNDSDSWVNALVQIVQKESSTKKK